MFTCGGSPTDGTGDPSLLTEIQKNQEEIPKVSGRNRKQICNKSMFTCGGARLMGQGIRFLYKLVSK